VNINVDVMTSVLALEDKCALKYVVETAWPATIDKFDKEAAAVFTAAWKAEEPFLGRIAQIISENNDDLMPLLDDCFDFPASRLHFATWSHLLGVVPELIDHELGWLLGAIEQSADEASTKLLKQILATKEEGVTSIRSLFDKQVKAKAPKDSGAVEEEAAPVSSGDSFRDADMPIEDRMAVAKGKDKFTQLWAAMAQTDCTACGYDCEGYAQAIADGTDKDLSKCVPGEDATANALKAIVG
jgi:hypothetical protein